MSLPSSTQMGGMGNSLDFSSQNLLSPMMVSSGGYSAAGLDEMSDSQFHSQRYKISFSDIPLSDTTTTTTQSLPDPTSICEKQCEEDDFCCGWNSGCGRPSCVLGCHIATVCRRHRLPGDLSVPP
ncbi:unnamed protein product [Symbiodinium sp. CCMP2592]|nr:unnamed protein product [Symbiodinium sp. CCMP2592]